MAGQQFLPFGVPGPLGAQEALQLDFDLDSFLDEALALQDVHMEPAPELQAGHPDAGGRADGQAAAIGASHSKRGKGGKAARAPGGRRSARDGPTAAEAANGGGGGLGPASSSGRDSHNVSTGSLGSTGSSERQAQQTGGGAPGSSGRSLASKGAPAEGSQHTTVGETKFFAFTPKFPFGRLAILGDATEGQIESTIQQMKAEADEHNAAAAASGAAHVYGDSRRSLHPYGSYSESSPLASGLGSSSRSLASGAPAADGGSARQLRQPPPSPRSIQGPGSGSHHSNLAEQPIDELSEAVPLEAGGGGAGPGLRASGLEQAGAVSDASGRLLPSLPSLPSWKDDYMGEADFSVHSGGRRRGGGPAAGPGPERRRCSGGESIRCLLRELDPLQHFVCKRQKCSRSVAPCKWDLFPGIRVGEEARRRGLPMARLQHLQSSGATADAAAAAEDTKAAAAADERSSPRGPLSVEDSESTRSSERDLARTFGLHELESAEALGASPTSSSEGWKLPTTIGSSSSSTAGSRPRARTEPARPLGEPPPRGLRHSNTAPALGGGGGAGGGVKATAKLSIQHYKGLTFVNEYALAGTLGRGSFGTVKLALNTRDQELYALKLIPKSRRARRGAAGAPLVAEAEVMQEIDVMKGLGHPNIVRLVEVIDDPLQSKMLMVLEYVEGGALFAGTKIQPKKRLTELSARKYFRDVLQGLDYLHANQIAHGDLKPDNLLLGADGHIKIADFGSSQLTRCDDLVSRAAGTPAFMAPEMCSGHAYHARMADVWALGVCLYMSIFGTVPFKADSILGLYDQICSAPLTFPPDAFVSDSLKHLLTRLLDKDPETRMSLPSVMGHHWVTHNGAYPLPNVQGLEPDEEPDEAALLMECWPDDPADIGLESVLKTIKPLFEQRVYPAGSALAVQGAPAACIFYIQEGEVEIFHKRADEAAEDGSEEEASDGEGDARPRLKRQSSMLKTMFCATVRASQFVSAVRDYADGGRTLLATRGPGSFIGEVQVYACGLEARWQTCVRAKSEASVLVLEFKNILEMVAKRPEVEGDVRAIMSQRRGELLKMNILEKLASLHRDLKEEVQAVTLANGATAEQISTARELLGLPRMPPAELQVPYDGSVFCCEAVAEARAAVLAERQAPAAAPAEEQQAESPLRVEASRESFEAKGDSAKTLTLYSKGSGQSGKSESPPPALAPSTFSAAH